MLVWQYLTTADQRIKLEKRVLSLYCFENLRDNGAVVAAFLWQTRKIVNEYERL